MSRGPSPAAGYLDAGPIETGTRQSGVWQSVADAQRKLSENLGAAVTAAQSASSLQLSLENQKLAEARAAFIDALTAAGETSDRHRRLRVRRQRQDQQRRGLSLQRLFRKMWPKLLDASATEAIAEKTPQPRQPPSGATSPTSSPPPRPAGPIETTLTDS